MRTASLLLAALLQLMPVCRLAVVSRPAADPAWGVVLSWTAGAVALLGSHDAVSGASAGISGLVKYSGTTPVGGPSYDVAEPMGEPFRYRITVSNPGSDFGKNYFNCVPLPPGLTINTNPGAAGYISGTPSAAGIYSVTLVAGNLSHPIPATAQATILIYVANAPPVISTQPKDQSVLRGGTAEFRLDASGAPPLTYQWRRDGGDLPGANSASLSLTNVQAADAAGYELIVSNPHGSVTSTMARLTVREPLAVGLAWGPPVTSNGVFHALATGPIQADYVVWQSRDLQTWTPWSTNRVVDGALQFKAILDAAGGRRFYRVSTLGTAKE